MNTLDAAALIAEAREPHYHNPEGIYSPDGQCKGDCLSGRLADALEHAECARNTDWRRFVRLSEEERIVELERRWRDAERERDLAANNILCSYCGNLDRKPEPWSHEAAMEIILEHLNTCTDHPLNKLALFTEELPCGHLSALLVLDDNGDPRCSQCWLKDVESQLAAAQAQITGLVADRDALEEQIEAGPQGQPAS